jgi:hypothetical protein
MEKNEQLENINVKIINSKAARAYTVKNHYMKTFPNPLVCFGVFHNKLLSGVVSFGLSPSTEQKIKKIVPKINRNEFIEMQRMHISDLLKQNTESYVLGKIYKLFKANTKIKLLITHSGGCKNDCGIVYQASSWMYFGKELCNDFYHTDIGEYKNIISPMRFGRVPKEIIKLGNQKVGEYLFGKGKMINSFRYLYLYPINKGIRSYLKKKCKVYPKDSQVFRKNQKWIKGDDQ